MNQRPVQLTKQVRALAFPLCIFSYCGHTNPTAMPRINQEMKGRESKTKLPNGESGCRGKHHGQKKEADSINHTFGNMMFRRDWLWSILCSMVWTVTMLCATRIWIQWMRALQTRSALDKSFLPKLKFIKGKFALKIWFPFFIQVLP